MHEARKLQDERAAQPQNRSSVRHKQPPRVRAQGCDLIGRRPELPAQPRRSAEVRRSGQCTRRAVSGALGRETSCCERGSSDGGGWPCPQQPCSRHLYNAGRVRLRGGHGLDGTSQPGRRRANARWVRDARSFGGLLMNDRSLDPGWPARLSGPIGREPGKHLVILLHSEGLPFTNAQEKTSIGSAKAANRGFIQLTRRTVCADQLQQM